MEFQNKAKFYEVRNHALFYSVLAALGWCWHDKKHKGTRQRNKALMVSSTSEG